MKKTEKFLNPRDYLLETQEMSKEKNMDEEKQEKNSNFRNVNQNAKS